jgi:hypothetical protein
VKKEGLPDEIYVLTNDSTEYHFSDPDFYFDNDSLFGKVSEIKVPFEGKFVLKESDSIEVNYINRLQSIMTMPEYLEMESEHGKPDEIYLIKNDTMSYLFKQDQYYFSSDTLYAKGHSIIKHQPRSVKNIALSEIKSIKVEKFSQLNTTFLIISIIAGLFAAFVIAFAISCSDGCFEWK